MISRLHRSIALVVAASAALVVALAPAESSSQLAHRAGYAWDDPDWRFTHGDRPVKVVLLAGSIGAFRDRPYGRLIHEWCENAEVRNLSQVGQGAPALLRRFRRQVLENPIVPFGVPEVETWLLYGGGMNSAALPHRTNDAARRTFVAAHQRQMRVVALSLTPWGDDGHADPRWEGAGALRALRGTRSIVGFTLGQAPPRLALGPLSQQRSSPDAPWTEAERPDIAVDLYDSRLRDGDAEPWPMPEVRDRIEGDATWRRSVSALSPEQREARLSQDAAFLSEAPRWFLRSEYRGFDHIHPNRAGHQVIAETACPSLPASWGCQCPRP